jgi:hypothetical protein
MAMMVKIRATSTGGDMKGYGPTTGTSDHVTGTYKGGFNWDTWPTPSNALQTGSIDTSQYCALPTTNGYRWHGETFGFAGSEAKIHDPSNNLGFNLDGHDYTKIKHSGVPNQDNISGSNTDYDYGDDVVCSIAVRVYAQAVSGGGGDD